MEESQSYNPEQGYYNEPMPVIYAGFWARFFAHLIDGLIMVVPLLILRFLFSGSLTDSNGIGSVVEIVVVWLYYAIQESGANQATFGKRVMEIKVTDMRGGRISFGRATGRYFAKILSTIILLIGYIMVAFTKRKQGLHDMIAETLVVSNGSF